VTDEDLNDDFVRGVQVGMGMRPTAGPDEDLTALAVQNRAEVAEARLRLVRARLRAADAEEGPYRSILHTGALWPFLGEED
jgi:hypothetical protein